MKEEQSRPLTLGQTVEMIIDNYGHEAEGVARVAGMAVFVAGALRGERIIGRIVELRKNFARAEIVEILQPSAERVTPQCDCYTSCGGCQLQHLDYRAQLRFKQQQVVDALERIGGYRGVRVELTLGMVEPWNYRNKVQYPVALVNGRLELGFYEKGTHKVVPLQDCHLQSAVGNQIATAVRNFAADFGVLPYDEHSGRGFLRHVLIREAFATSEFMVVLVTNGSAFAAGKALAERLMTKFPMIKGVLQNINNYRGNAILGQKTILLAGVDRIEDFLGDLRFMISPRSFFQVNPVQAKVLYEKAVEYAALSGTETVVDAYCGVGSLTLFLARHAAITYGIEVIPEAIVDAEINARLNGLGDKTRFVAAKTEEELPRLYASGVKFDVAVVDPPRSGCDPIGLKTLTEIGVKRIVYVSCNPATMARDVKLLSEWGYELQKVQPVDMFPMTHHVETVVLLTKVQK